MDVLPPFIAHRQAPELPSHAIVRSTAQRCHPCFAEDSIPLRPIRALMRRWCNACRERGNVIRLVGMQFHRSGARSSPGTPDRVDRTEPAPLQAGLRWPVERTHAWMNGYGKLRRCTERCARVVDAYLFLAATFVVVRCLIR